MEGRIGLGKRKARVGAGGLGLGGGWGQQVREIISCRPSGAHPYWDVDPGVPPARAGCTPG